MKSKPGRLQHVVSRVKNQGKCQVARRCLNCHLSGFRSKTSLLTTSLMVTKIDSALTSGSKVSSSKRCNSSCHGFVDFILNWARWKKLLKRTVCSRTNTKLLAARSEREKRSWGGNWRALHRLHNKATCWSEHQMLYRTEICCWTRLHKTWRAKSDCAELQQSKREEESN